MFAEVLGFGPKPYLMHDWSSETAGTSGHTNDNGRFSRMQGKVRVAVK